MENVIGPLLAFAGSLVPVMGLVWKTAMLAARVSQNKVDINHVGEKVTRLEMETDRKFDEITANLNKIDVKLASIETMLNLLTKEKKL
ncbi:MAG: hypothetical protein LBK61_02135 [Spirochaetaceae bacterium]|jgi:hypothetical protein|nr:hypothetical protein [Spirochaetaceae bacterium]